MRSLPFLLIAVACVTCSVTLSHAAPASGAAWTADASPEALLTSPELIGARLKYVRRLTDGQKFREALQELLELRTEVPRRQGLPVDYNIAMTYRAIADAICDGYMGENPRGELIYVSEADGYGAWGTNRSRMADSLAVSNVGKAITNWVKRSRTVVLESGPDFITNVLTNLTVVTNAFSDLVVTSNWVVGETVETNVDVRVTETTNRQARTREITKTNWIVSSNVTYRVSTNVSSNIIVLSNMSMATNRTKTKVTEDVSFESQAYEFYPGSFSGVKVLKNVQVQTNFKLTTIIKPVTNIDVRTIVAYASNAAYENATVADDDLVTILTNRQELVTYVTNGANSWAFHSNQVPRVEYVSNTRFETNVLVGPGTKYGSVEESVPVVTWVATAVDMPRPPARSRRLTPLALKYYDLSVRWLNRLIANGFENPFQESAMMRKGEIYRDIEQPSLAVEVFGQFQRQFPRSAQVLTAMVERANVYLSLGRLDDAEVVILEALQVFPESDQKAFLGLKLEYLRALRATKAGVPGGAPRPELERKARQLELFEAELRKKELRVRELEKPVRP